MMIHLHEYDDSTDVTTRKYVQLVYYTFKIFLRF